MKIEYELRQEVSFRAVWHSDDGCGSATNARHLLRFRTRGEKGFWRKWLLYCALSPKPPLQKPLCVVHTKAWPAPRDWAGGEKQNEMLARKLPLDTIANEGE